MAEIRWRSQTSWRAKSLKVTTRSTVQGFRASASGLPDLLLSEAFTADDRLSVRAVYDVEPTTALRRATHTVPPIDFDVPIEQKESYVVVARHPSGALTFHAPRQIRRRSASGRKTGSACRFLIPITPDGKDGPARRGILSKVVKIVVVKVREWTVDKAVDALGSLILPKVSALAERRIWKAKGLREGWLRVDPQSLRQGKLKRVDMKKADLSGGRCLLFLHGTFSNAVGAFGALAATDLEYFERLQELYGDRMFAYDHFTISKTPVENARDLLRKLPARPHEFDVVTHSRGGLVLRSLTELPAELGELASRFAVGRAVLVASPNEGTQLASPDHWSSSLGWMANLLEVVPDNPLTTAAEFVVDSLTWLAGHVVGNLPGLAAMDMNGSLIAALQDGPEPPAQAYSALVANYAANDSLLKRAADVGVDAFFGVANDLVVPTSGGWRVSVAGAGLVPADRVGCYGPGGNLRQDVPEYAHHLNLFSRRETADFIVRALAGEPQDIALQDPYVPLPDARFWRGRGGEADRFPVPVSSTGAPEFRPGTGVVPGLQGRDAIGADELHLVILPRHEGGKTAQLLATYGNARVLEDFPTKGGEAGARFQKIIKYHEHIRRVLDGRLVGELPNSEKLIDLGITLFETLFRGDVRRLYDVARSQQGGRRLNVVLTSMIGWITDKPWEFAYDPSRRTYLATEEVHFVRNVLSAVPAERIVPTHGALNILVVVAQPIGTGQLSADEETRVIRRGFEPLIAAGLARVEVLTEATPSRLHAAVLTRRFDVVHFIGHGDFDEQEKQGYLLFQGPRGGIHRVGVRTLREILCQRGIRLVFLNACESGRGGRADFNRGVGSGIVAAGVPAVVANQYLVLDAAATEFSRRFYWALALGSSLGAAAREARISVNYSIVGESLDWAVPVLYARDPDECLRGASDFKPAAAPREAVDAPTRRRAGGPKAVRVALWDIGASFPELERLVARLNAAQKRFVFEVTDVSAPLGTWRRMKTMPGESDAYIYAEAVAERLRTIPEQLGVDYLFCITHHMMMCDLDEDSYLLNALLWWTTTGNDAGLSDRILLFSTASLDLPARGPVADRAVINQVVAGLAAARAGIEEAHEGGAKSCPLHYDEERDPAIIGGPAKFDALCRRRLQKAIPTDLVALDQILAAFRE